MIASLIFVVSAVALFQFFVSYCRSLVAAYSKVELSEQSRVNLSFEIPLQEAP